VSSHDSLDSYEGQQNSVLFVKR